ncbi:MAG: hypothetical protein ACXQTS_02630 [Candidatus Methanospirareceae archaeon]
MMKIELKDIAMGVGVYPIIAFGVEIDSPSPFEEVHIVSFICKVETAFAEGRPVFLGYATPRSLPTVIEKAFFGIDFELDRDKIAKIEELRKGEDVWLRLSGSIKYAILLERRGDEFENIKMTDDDFVINQYGVPRIRIEKEKWEDYLSFLNIRKQLIIEERVASKLERVRQLMNPKLDDVEVIEELLDLYLRGK